MFLYEFIKEILPPICLLCKNTIKHNSFPRNICSRCSAILPIRNINESFGFIDRNKNNLLMSKHNKLPLFVATFYEDLIRYMITSLKFHQRKELAIIIGDILTVFWNRLKRIATSEFIENYLHVDYTIPVPLHKLRYIERGYNQTELFCKVFSDNLNIKMLNNTLIRKKATKRQSEAGSLLEREVNIDKAFECNNLNISNKKVLLIDDVISSGSTLRQAASVLEAQNAKVILLTFASNMKLNLEGI